MVFQCEKKGLRWLQKIIALCVFMSLNVFLFLDIYMSYSFYFLLAMEVGASK